MAEDAREGERRLDSKVNRWTEVEKGRNGRGKR